MATPIDKHATTTHAEVSHADLKKYKIGDKVKVTHHGTVTGIREGSDGKTSKDTAGFQSPHEITVAVHKHQIQSAGGQFDQLLSDEQAEPS